MSELADYEWLVADEAAKWLAECAASNEPSHRRQDHLRKALTANRARLVVQQTALRRKAVEKFGDRARCMFFTDISLQQATDRWIAAYKAGRFVNSAAIVDYCCGIGGDLLALASETPTVGWDGAPLMVLFAEANLRAWQLRNGSRVSMGRVEDHPPAPACRWHLDPDRRAAGRRSTQVVWHSPGEDIIQFWLQEAPHGAIKLAPATVPDAHWLENAELEWISHNRQCRQMVAWFGDLAQARGQRRATVVHESTAHSFIGEASAHGDLADAVGRFVYDTDPAIRAARLTAELANSLGCRALGTGESYLTADESVDHPLLSTFEVLDVLPLRLTDLVKHLRSRDVGSLEIKTRGVATNPEQVRRMLNPAGSSALTLLLTRHGKREIAIVAMRKNAG